MVIIITIITIIINIINIKIMDNLIIIINDNDNK